MKTYDLVCFGEVLYDVHNTKKELAGAPLNTASFASLLGLKTALISAIGNETYEPIEDEITRRNIDSFIQRSNYTTGKARIHLNKKKVPTFSIEQNSAYDHIRKTEALFELAKNAKFFYFGTLSQRHEHSRNTLMGLLLATNGTVVYDLNLRKGIPLWRSLVNTSLGFTTILKMNEYELEKVKELTDCKKLGQLFNGTNIGCIFVTLGEKGACLYQKNKEPLFVASPKVNVVDTTGCGDAFTASIIFGFSQNWYMPKMLEFAVDFSAQVAQYEGAFDSDFLVESGIVPS